MYYALQCFEKASFINNVILVTSEDCVDYCQKKIVEKYGFRKVEKIVVGGKERYDSVYAGLLACGETDYVYIHDGIRPFITREILERALDGARETGACVVGMPSKDTVKIVDKEQFVTKTPKRARVWAVQTPQVFDAGLLKAALQSALTEHAALTDDCSAVERLGKVVYLTDGDEENIKITTPLDLIVAETILRRREEREAEK